MKAIYGFVGVLLILFGIVTFAYQGFTYTKREPVAQLGDLKVTKDTEKTVYLSPVLGGLSLVAGIVLVVVSRKSP